MSDLKFTPASYASRESVSHVLNVATEVDDAAIPGIVAALEALLDIDSVPASELVASVRPQPYECTVVVSMPCDDGVAIRPEDVTDALERMGAHVLQWHDENLLESGDDA